MMRCPECGFIGEESLEGECPKCGGCRYNEFDEDPDDE